MTSFNNMLLMIAQELEIEQGSSESADSWKVRIIYSVLGRMGYASLHDIQEDGEPASITHFKSRIEAVLGSYLKMYPEIESLITANQETLINEIYDILLSTGQMYHTPNRVVAAAPCSACFEHVEFLRGMGTDYPCSVSGLGCYTVKEEEKSGSPQPLQSMFGLHETPLTKAWDKLVQNREWSELSDDGRLEYLRTKPPFTYGYWLDKPEKTPSVSIARSGQYGNYLYYLYKRENSQLQFSQLPSWMTEDKDYLFLSNCCLSSLNVLPPVSYHMDGNLVSVKLNYLLPKQELNLLKLYSWPSSFSAFPQDFRRVLAQPVFLSFKTLLENVGYQFKEE